MIMVVGSKGNMGSRYKAILRYLNKDMVGVDVDTDETLRKKMVQKCDGIIIATPTDTHYKAINEYAQYGKPILCEKPITKSLDELQDIVACVDRARIKFNMVYQYKQFVPGAARGLTSYDYFKHGQDGLHWDCLQIIGLAKGKVTLSEESPIWKCQINGERLNLNLMDAAYIKMVEDWMHEPGMDLSEIVDIHTRVEEMRVRDLHGGV